MYCHSYPDDGEIELRNDTHPETVESVPLCFITIITSKCVPLLWGVAVPLQYKHLTLTVKSSDFSKLLDLVALFRLLIV